MTEEIGNWYVACIMGRMWFVQAPDAIQAELMARWAISATYHAREIPWGVPTVTIALAAPDYESTLKGARHDR